MRKLENYEVMEAIRLSEYAFQYQIPEEELEKRKAGYLQHEIWGDFEGEDLAAKLHLIDFETWLAGKTYAMGGIASVATYPEYRRGGRVAQLLRHALSEMKNKGQTISFLHPFEISFYRKFGFEVLSSWKKLKLKKEDFQPLPRVNGKVRRISLEHVYETLNPVYETFAKRFNGMLVRTEQWWKERVYSEGFLFASYTNEDGEITGYAYYQVKDRALEVEEFVCLDGEARRGLWNYLCHHDSMIDGGTLLTHEGDPFTFLLSNPKVKTKVEAYFMARIVDVESFLTDYPFEMTDAESLFLHIQDEHAEWNNGSFHIKSNAIDVYRGDKANASCEHPPKRGLRCSINTLTAILTGYQTPEFLYQAGLLEGSEKDLEVLKRIVPQKETNFMDFF
ncbi:GNAT family N-acetyltransferase [Pseudalkalibacillus hwajinpoensis]|uniref:GNAT family N-acetyltransferase n=1 Tax=Guptibacillus hwajinpoensis TaxID=208199 RepID=A0A4U1MJ02_9BACL|nr:GNAT family N-acetyltransferase [Pseudalkalibacillus hwajinpoensis]TKD70466.1 GNAT family N-acetyltransferase [Pseudalkalibacillus hwajinpoensis]